MEFIETLDDLSTAIHTARQGIEGPKVASRRTSMQVGLKVTDIAGQNGDNGVEPEVQGAKRLLESWQGLVETLFSQRVFLKYAPYLATCIGKLSGLETDEVVHVRTIVDLMRHTVEHNKIHDCTELRYATLLEIMMSYNLGWEGPSEMLSGHWSIIGQQVSADMEPDKFRRQAYGVLVSLPWIPSSNGLYTACSFDEDEAIYWDLPPPMLSKVDELGDDRLLRSDLVNFILHRIRRSPIFRVVISCAVAKSDAGIIGSSDIAGVGKTSLAAMLAAHPTIAEKYKTVWVDLPTTVTEEGRDIITYEQYMTCLHSICRQLSVEPNWPEPVKRLENTLIRIRRQKEFMTRAKHAMARLLQRLETDTLIVMDDVRDEREFELFNFMENQSSIVITQSYKSIRSTCTMQLEPLSEDEALHLFAVESGSQDEQEILRTFEAKSIVDQCRRHPLVIRTAARWFKVKQISAGLAKALEELTLELSILRNNSLAKTPITKVLAEVMNIMLSPARRQGGQPTKIMKLCLASFSVVFSEPGPVSFDAVLALWCQVISSAPPAREELGDDYSAADLAKRAYFTAEAFIQLGLFDRTTKDGRVYVTIHHRLYLNYGISVLSEVGSLGVSIDDLKAKWHEKFVAGYNERRKKISKSKKHTDTIRKYALEKLVHHSIEAKTIPQVVEKLRDEKFYKERLKALGWRRGTTLQIDDCLMLQKKAKESGSATPAEIRKVILSILKKMASVLAEDSSLKDDTRRLEKAIALHHVGFTQADNNSISEALTQYKSAMQLVTAPNHPFNAVLMYSQAVLHLARNDHDKAFKKLKACQKVLKETADQETSPLPLIHLELVQLKGDSLVAACDYLGAANCYEAALDQMKGGSKIETGTALFRRGRLHQLVGELHLASSALNESITWKMDLGETCSTNLAEAYSLVGDINVELQKEEKALENFDKALAVLLELEDEAEEVDLHLLQGKIASLRGDVEASKQSFDEARKYIKKSPSMFMDHSAYDLRCMARICMDRGEMSETVELLEESLELTLERQESLERGSILFDLGQCMSAQSEDKEAMACFEESLEIRKKALGDCELVLDTQTTLGEVYKKLQMDMQRLGASQQVLELTQTLFRRDDRKVAAALFGVGEAHEAMKAYDDAVTKYIQCKDLLERALPLGHPDRPDIANVLQRLGDLYASHDDFDKAHESYLAALDIRTSCYEPEHPELGETFYCIGHVARRRDDLEEARDHLLDALEINKKLELSQETCLTLAELGTVYRLRKEPDRAITCYKRCLTIFDPEVCESSLFGRAQLELGHAQFAKGEFREALACYERGEFASDVVTFHI